MKTKLLSFITLAALSLPLKSVAQYGELDPSFGLNGLTEAPIGQYAEEMVSDLLLLPNGQMLLASTQYIGTSYDFIVKRYNSDGSQDPTFGGMGSFVFDNGGFADHLKAMAFQADGKIILFGYSVTTPITMLAVRIDSNGFIDTDFGSNGSVSISIPSSDTYGNDVVVQPNGKIILAGHAIESGFEHFEVVSLNPNGSMNNSFGSSGMVSTQNSTSTGVYPSIELQPDGKIVIAGMGMPSSGQQHYCVMRLNSDGSSDTGFGPEGVRLGSVDPSYTHQWPYGMTIQPDGKIIVVGSAGYFGNSSMTFMRFNADGELDAGFANGGVRILSATLGDNFLTDVLVQPDGVILACGFIIDLDGNEDWILTRVDADGNPDITFGVNTFVNTPLTGFAERALAISMQADGKILAAGHSHENNIVYSAIARYESGVDVGVDEATSENAIAIYPNPSNGLYNISIPIDVRNKSLTIRNTLGQIQLSVRVSGLYTQLDLSGLADGVYFLSTDGEAAIPTKLIKQSR
jgi:uncharacterized delta-60 repeat protein